MWTISAKKVAPETTLLRFESKNNIKLIYGSEYWKFQRAQIWEFGVSCWRRLRQAPFCVSYDIPASHQDVTVCATTTRHNSWLHAIKTVRTLISDVPLVESSSKCWHSAHAVQEQVMTTQVNVSSLTTHITRTGLKMANCKSLDQNDRFVCTDHNATPSLGCYQN